MRSGHIAVVLSVFAAACASEQARGAEPSAGIAAPAASPPASAPATPAANPSAGAAGTGLTAMPAPSTMAAPGSSELPTSPDSTPPQAPTGAAPGTGGGEFCGVQALMQAHCQACHAATPVAGAPMPLMTYDDFMKPASSDANRKVHELVRERMHDDKRPMPPAGILPQDKLSALDTWVAAGALQPSAACPEQAPTEAGPDTTSQPWPPADCEDVYKITAHDLADPSKPYTIAAGAEEHPLISFDAPWGDDDVQLLATRPITDNASLIHHWILWDSLEGGNLTFWAPGAGGDVLPPDVGLYVPKGPASLGLDMHYFNRASAEPAQDASGLEMCITRTFRPKTAAIYGLRGNATVPAMQRVENAVPCTVTAPGEAHFLGITPHMHKLGVHARLDLQRGSAPMQVLYDAPYNFEEQTLKPLDNIMIMNGDVLTTTCTYENDTTRNIVWGDATEDEMCFNWMRYYPKGGFSCLPLGGGRGGLPGLPGGLPLPGTP